MDWVAIAWGWDLVRVEPDRTLASVGEPADPHLRAGCQGHDARPQEPLEIDGQVKPAAPELLQESSRPRHSGGRQLGPAPVVSDDLVKRGMAVKQASERVVDHPGDPRLGPTPAQSREYRGTALTMSPTALGLIRQTR